MTDVAITYATYPTAFETPGGGEIQILQYRKHLTAAGVAVSLFDPWKPNLGGVDVFHYFSCYRGSEIFIDELFRRGLPIVLSPTLWIEQGAVGYPMAQIGQMMAMAGRIVCNSDMECDLLSETFSVPRYKFATVYNGVDPAFMQPVDPALFRAHIGIRGDFVLNVANVEPRKNQLRLIEAVRRLGLQLVMIGGIRDQGYFEQCMALGQGCLTYIPALPHDSELLRSAYAACSLFALPSTLETPGLAALEAACVGARVLVTEVGCAREYFQDHATYADPLSVDAIAAGIEKGLTFPDPDAARDLVRQQFTWPVVLRRLLDLYRNRDVFGPALAARGFHLAGLHSAEGGWHVWSKRSAGIVCDQSGVLMFEWRAAQASRVTVKVNGGIVWPGVEVGTETSLMTLVMPFGEGGQRPLLEFEVHPLDRETMTEDPRELGVALKDVRFVTEPEEMRQAGMLFERHGLQGQGWYRAEEDSAGQFVWSKRSAEVVCDRPGVLMFEWRAAQESRVDVTIDGEVLWSGLEVGTDWVPTSIRLQSVAGGRSHIVFKVTPLDPTIRSADPRELGVALRGVEMSKEQQVLQ